MRTFRSVLAKIYENYEFRNNKCPVFFLDPFFSHVFFRNNKCPFFLDTFFSRKPSNLLILYPNHILNVLSPFPHLF